VGAYTQLKQWGDAPFVGSATPDGLYNPAGGNKWDDLTFDVSGHVKAGATQVATKLSHNTSSFDCLSFGYISASFALQDKDADGLLDAWETYGLTDPKTGSVGDNPPPKFWFR
jgi:hypothetical protein